MKFKITEHNIFLLSIWLKGLNGLAEIIGGLLVVVFGPQTIVGLVNYLTLSEISEDPHDLIANYLIHSASGYTVNSQFFWAAYLLIHGLIKIFLVISLMTKRLWAYPTAIIIFSLFIVYQLYRFSFTHSLLLIILSLFDVLVIVLTYLEYQRLKGLQLVNK